MGGEVQISDHARSRIIERLEITPERVAEILLFGLYAEVVNPRVPYSKKYLVAFDHKKREPFLLILKRVKKIWILLTVFETYINHTKRDFIRVMRRHISEAMKKHKEHELLKQEAAKKEAQEAIVVDVVFRYLSPTGGCEVVRCRLGKILYSEYIKRLKEDHKQLFRELVSTADLSDQEVPKDTSVYYELYQSSDEGKRLIVCEEV